MLQLPAKNKVLTFVKFQIISKIMLIIKLFVEIQHLGNAKFKMCFLRANLCKRTPQITLYDPGLPEAITNCNCSVFDFHSSFPLSHTN